MGWWLRGFVVAVAGVCLAATAVAAPARYSPPRTADGAPDLGGVWTTESLTSLERSGDFRSLIVPDAEAEAYERRSNDPDAVQAERLKALPRAPDVDGVHTDWDYGSYPRLARIAGQARSSVLIDPPSGKLPLLPAARARLRARRMVELRNFDGPEARPLPERCLPALGPPMVISENFHIVQTRDHVAIVPEWHYEPRIIRLTDRRHGPAQLQSWLGDSIGWWEGDTLVVETVHFNPGRAFWTPGVRAPMSPQAKVTERFSRTRANEILYRFTVEDPANYSQPWSGVLPLTHYPKALYEYACHEGNYSMANILAGARRAEREGRVPEPLDGGDPPSTPAAP